MYFTTATRMALIEHARNRMALWLIALYLPSWLAATYLIIPDQPIMFVLRASGDTLWAHGNELSQISGVLNTVCRSWLVVSRSRSNQARSIAGSRSRDIRGVISWRPR